LVKRFEGICQNYENDMIFKNLLICLFIIVYDSMIVYDNIV